MDMKQCMPACHGHEKVYHDYYGPQYLSNENSAVVDWRLLQKVNAIFCCQALGSFTDDAVR